MLFHESLTILSIKTKDRIAKTSWGKNVVSCSENAAIYRYKKECWERVPHPHQYCIKVGTVCSDGQGTLFSNAAVSNRHKETVWIRNPGFDLSNGESSDRQVDQ